MALQMISIKLDTVVLEAMREVRMSAGVPVTTQIDFAVRQWLDNRRDLDRKHHGIKREVLCGQQRG